MSTPAVGDILSSADAGRRVIRGGIWRMAGNFAGILAGVGTAALLLRHLGVTQSGRYVTVLSLVAIASSVIDVGLNISASRELSLLDSAGRVELMRNVLGQRLLLTPLAWLAIVAFAIAVGYPQSMRVGTVLVGFGMYLVAVADALLLPLAVELRNAGLAAVDFLKQAVTLVCVAALVALGAQLTAFFAVLIAAGLLAMACVPVLVGRGALLAPRLDRLQQRALLHKALPLAAALVLGQLYFRLAILMMSLISDPVQTGYFAGSLRAMETLLMIPVLIAGVALPLLSAAARDDRRRLRHAVQGLSQGALIVGILVVLIAIRAAEPVMRIIGSSAFGPSGAVLRIQVGALLFGALVQIWAVALVALGRQRELILTNALGLLGMALFAAVLIPAFGAKGGAAASVLGDAVLACLTWWRLRACGLRVSLGARFIGRVVLAALCAAVALALPVAGLLAAALAAAAFLVVGQLIGMVPKELHQALGWQRLMWWRAG